ncbi:transglutaminase-like cysteine peptidase [Indioceanicola profundi]|uniref:transglutaminase-like cysteine peptidase n=1 Tax=Indioceanicola profundi TaxID=2220096 RepID=UPI000E6A97BA|nr:transglutaminase-like cysteine peptidase [Indioceanicola profundi]
MRPIFPTATDVAVRRDMSFRTSQLRNDLPRSILPGRLLAVAGIVLLVGAFVLRHDAVRLLTHDPGSRPLHNRLVPFVGLFLLVSVAVTANAQTIVWGGEVEPLPQYASYCKTYGARDPGCAAALGGRAAALAGPDRLKGRKASLSMATHIHREVVTDLAYTPEAEDVWQILGTRGTGMQGDCDDVVMTTISRLIRRGYPRGALRATLVELPDGQGHHLILGVRLEDREVFLDDRHRWPQDAAALEALGYRFLSQEVPGHTHWQRAQRAVPPSDQVAEKG